MSSPVSRFRAPALATVLLVASCGRPTITAGLSDLASSQEEPDLATPQGAPDLAPPDLAGCIDDDGDGYGRGCPLGADCNDRDRNVHPGAPEYCGDGLDQNCDGRADEAGCLCRAGETRACYTGVGGTEGVGPCRAGLARCGNDGAFGACQGEVKPAQAETCDGVDNDCDGQIDEGVKNACGGCGAVPTEVCGDSLDNDCNGQIDEGCGSCDPNCQCSGNQCVCRPPTNQPCYGGPPATAGVGLCQQGVRDCVQQGNVFMWGPCVGQVTPASPVCDGKDHDCDGANDDSLACACVDGASRTCGSALGECRSGRQTCRAGQWGACAGSVAPAAEVCDGKDNDCNGVVDEGVTNACGGCGPVPREVCGDGLDNDCNGKVDEVEASCTCGGKAQQACYRGPAATRGVGVCKDGIQFCVRQEIGDSWGDCSGDALPKTEVCGDSLDNDCNGKVDEGCSGCVEGATRPCGSAVGECRPGVQTCKNGSFGACVGVVGAAAESCDSKDNDCDGLVDEGTLNACGKCPPSPCYVQDYDTPGDCRLPGRTCDSTIADPNNPKAITLGETTNTLFPYIYIAVTGRNEVALLDTETGIKLWQKPSWGMQPSRTAVALDGTVWVGNRCLSGNPNDVNCSNLVHLDLNGNLICRADLPGIVRGVAIDADGNAWGGTYNGQTVWKVSGTEVDKTQSPPRCRVLNSLYVGLAVYGLAVDGRGFLWTATAPFTRKIDTKNALLVDSVPNDSFYGIAIDKQNRVWFGGWSGGRDMHRIDGDPPYNTLRTGVIGVTAVTVHPDGSVWGSRYDGNPRGAVKVTLDRTGAVVTNVQYLQDPFNDNNHGIAVDRAGKVWSVQRGLGQAIRWRPTGDYDGRFAVDVNRELYSYSDMTGIQLRTITVREGHWIQQFDSGYARPIWDHAEWTANIPAGTSVTVMMRAADSAAAFANGGATQWCGPFQGNQSPIDFAARNCGFLNNHRLLQTDFKLGTTVDGAKPTVSNFKVFWSY